MIDPPPSTLQPSPDGEVVVLAGGDTVPPEVAQDLPADAFVIAADSGLALASVLALDVDILVGDLDSVDPAHLAAARDRGIPVDQHPVDKDRTDLAIALDAAMARSPRRVTVVGGHGGRLDHLVANVALLAADAYAEVVMTARMGDASVAVARDGRVTEIAGRPGDLVSLIPMHGVANGVTTTGLRFALDGDDLSPGSSRGVSNELTGPRATITLRAGVVLVIQPGAVHDR